MGRYARECTAPVHSSQGQRGDTGYRHGQTKKGKDHHECLQRTRGAEVCSPSERESHCKVQDDMPNLVILKVKSMTKRADSLRVLVDSGASNNFVRQQSLPLLDFEEKHVSRSQLEVRLATDAIVKTEKRVIRARFSYKHRKKRRRRRKTLRKSRAGTETLDGVSAGQTQMATMAVETLNVLTRASTGYQYQKMELENPPTDASELTSLPVMS
ncbi:reverse transcriptase [Phytophthora megakarya]|uniref:Reverse transcriptase n=1 Tax=Phytophthora megakarya TaxID=4795 RepID=A0A225UV16_9STRA|nr:reverse transcriptase [Phytophthora megakarya]